MNRRIIVHSLADARAAVAAAASLGRPVTLMSPAGAGAYAGPLWFKALVDAAASSFPEISVAAVIDCGDEAGTVLAALRAGFRRVRFAGDESMRARLAEIAAPLGAEIEDAGPMPVLDLLDRPDAEAACRSFLREEADPAG